MTWLRRNFDTAFLIVQVVVDGVCILGAFMLAVWLVAPEPGVHGGTFSNLLADHRSLGIISLFMTLLCFWVFGLYQWQKSILNVEEYRSALKAVCLGFLLTAAYLFLFKNFGRTFDKFLPGMSDTPLARIAELLTVTASTVGKWHKGPFVATFVFAYLLVVVQRLVMFNLIGFLHGAGFGNSNVVVYGSGPMALRVEQKMRLFPFLGFHFVGFIEDDADLIGKQIRGHKVLGDCEALASVCEEYQVRRVIIAKPELDETTLVELCARLEGLGVEYMVVPRLYHFFSQRFVMESLDTIPLLHPVHKASRHHVRLFKRCFDLLVGSFFMICALPIFLLVSVLVKMGSTGPVFFTQTRVGEGGRTFRMLKFRTMHTDMCEDSATPQSSGDPRIIPMVGHFLRRTSLDELPQLVNVIKGDMSLVGPRPEMPFIVETYTVMERMRLELKPGLTGLWQVSEGRNAPIHENLDYDLYYIENQSLFLDLVILGLTVVAVPLRATH